MFVLNSLIVYTFLCFFVVNRYDHVKVENLQPTVGHSILPNILLNKQETLISLCSIKNIFVIVLHIYIYTFIYIYIKVLKLPFQEKIVIKTGATKTSTLILLVAYSKNQFYDWLLLFIINVNDLNNVSEIFEPTMFAHDTNLFFSHKNIKELFHTLHLELSEVFQWPNVNKLSIVHKQ